MTNDSVCSDMHSSRRNDFMVHNAPAENMMSLMGDAMADDEMMLPRDFCYL